MIFGLKIPYFIFYIITKPISYLWENIYKVRRFLYNFGILKRSHFQVPIISIGNITFGGTGKTPFTIWLSEYLENRNNLPLVLTRGHKGALESTSGILKGGDSFRYNPIDFGDEALLIARKMKKGTVIVGKKRSQNLKYYFEDISPDVILLDDGFQHLELFRNLNLVLFDALLPLERYQVPPLGYLREGKSALVDANAIVISRAELAGKKKLEKLENLIKPFLASDRIPIIHIKYSPIGLFNDNYKKVMDVSELKGKKVVALAALASPSGFFNLIEDQGAEIVEHITFPDHHFFTNIEIIDAQNLAQKNDALLVTTEKDMVKIRSLSNIKGILYLSIGIEFLKGEQELLKLIDQVLDENIV